MMTPVQSPLPASPRHPPLSAPRRQPPREPPHPPQHPSAAAPRPRLQVTVRQLRVRPRPVAFPPAADGGPGWALPAYSEADREDRPGGGTWAGAGDPDGRLPDWPADAEWSRSAGPPPPRACRLAIAPRRLGRGRIRPGPGPRVADLAAD